MALVLTEEQSMLRDSVRGLISDKAPVAHLRHLRDSRDATGFSRELWKTFAEMGFTGLLVPEEFGGSGLGCVEAGVVMEEIGRNLTPSPLLSTAVLAASALSQGGSRAQRGEYLPKIAAGELVAALAIDEGAKHRPLQTEMQAVRSGQIDFAAVPLTAAAGSGLAMPGLFADARNPALPDVPTFKEQGYDIAPLSFGGLLGPAGMPDEVTHKLESACVAIIKSDAAQRVVKNTLQPADYFADSAGFARDLEKDVAEKTRLVPMLNLK